MNVIKLYTMLADFSEFVNYYNTIKYYKFSQIFFIKYILCKICLKNIHHKMNNPGACLIFCILTLEVCDNILKYSAFGMHLVQKLKCPREKASLKHF